VATPARSPNNAALPHEDCSAWKAIPSRGSVWKNTGVTVLIPPWQPEIDGTLTPAYQDGTALRGPRKMQKTPFGIYVM
jgi:hypothetical protein